MDIILEYWDREDYSTNSVIKKTETISGSKIDIFKKFDAKNNSLRYCNGSYYKFQDKEIQKEYNIWYKSLDKQTKFNMYYGGGIVD